MKTLSFSILLFLFICFEHSSAQGENNNWYFGRYAGITFNTPDGEPKALTDAALRFVHRVATISDKYGDLLFYTNGDSVMNKEHKMMENGYDTKRPYTSGIDENIIIVPLPESEEVYYIFKEFRLSQNKSSILYSVVDMNFNRGLGKVIKKNEILFDGRFPVITSIRHANGIDYWIIGHETDSSKFRAYLLSKDGIDMSPVLSETGKQYPVDSGPVNSEIKASPDENWIAKVSGGEEHFIKDGKIDSIYMTSLVELFTFDRWTGKISGSDSISIDVITNDVEFSNDGKYLYTGAYDNGYIDEPIKINDNDTIFQFDLSSLNNKTINESKTAIHITKPFFGPYDHIKKNNMTGLQLGPNGKIYVSNVTSVYLDVIRYPDKKGKDCEYIEQSVFLEGRTNNHTFLNLVKYQDFSVPSIIAKPRTCSNDTLFLNILHSSLLRQVIYKWSGPNGFNSDLKSPYVLNFSQENIGFYSVIMTHELGSFEDSIYVDILQSPQPEIIPDGPLQFCEGGSVNLSLGGEYESIEWTTGETSEEITVSEPLTIGVTVIDTNGCDGYAEVEVIVSDSLSPVIYIVEGEKEFCEGDSVVLGTRGDYVSYRWSNGDTTATTTISSRGGYYYVFATNELGCEGTSKGFLIKVNPLPKPIIIGQVNLCFGAETDYLNNNARSDEIEWYLESGGEIIGDINNDTVLVQWTKTGTWELIVQQTNEYGCVNSDTLLVEISPPFTPEITYDGLTLCPGGSITLSAPEGFSSYLWNTDETTREIEITKIGTYSVKVTDENGCIGTDAVEVTEADSIDVSIVGVLEFCPGKSTTLIADKDYASYYWEETGDTTREITVTEPGRYVLIVKNKEGCSGIDSVDVTEIDAELIFTDDNTVDLGRILLGFDSEITVTINNPSVYDIVYSARLKNNTKQISIVQPNNIILANSTHDLLLTFTPDYPQYYNDSLIIEAISPCETSITKAITGAGYTTSKVWLPDTTAVPDTRDYCIPLRAVITNDYISDLNLSYSAVINTDASLIIPTNKHSISGRDLQIKLNNSIVSLSNNTSIIGNICGWIIFADQDITPINITEFAWDNELVEVERIDGSVEIDGVCARNLRRVGGFKLTVMQISPNPADQSIKISIESGEVGTFELSIYSTEGIEIKSHKWHRIKTSPELNEINIDLSNISSGIYRIMLRSPMEIISQPLSVVK